MFHAALQYGARSTAPFRRVHFHPRMKARIRIPDAVREYEEPPSTFEAPVLGRHVQDWLPVVPGQDAGNFYACVDKRINYYDGASLHPAFLASARSALRRLSGRQWPKFHFTKELFDGHIAKFGEEKQARMRRALERIPDITCQDYSDKKIFVKVEALLKRHDPTWAPRVIYQGSDVYNALAGPMFGELMTRLVSCFDSWDANGVKVATAYKRTTEQISEWISADAGARSFLESDFSANDKTQVGDVHELESVLMRRLGAPAWFMRLHRLARKAGVSCMSHGFRAEVPNQMATGAVDTTFRNTVWNWTVFITFCKRYPSVRGRVIFLGDDMLFVGRHLPRGVERKYTAHCKRAHMLAKVHRHTSWDQVSFLSRHFVVRDGGHPLMVPFLGKAVARFNVRANANQSVSDDDYCFTKALSYAYEFRAFPTFSHEFLQRAAFHSAQGGRFKREASTWSVHGLEPDPSVLTRGIRAAQVFDDAEYSRFLLRRYGLVLSDLEDDVIAILDPMARGPYASAALHRVLCKDTL